MFESVSCRVRSSNGITRNCGNYRYGNYIGTATVGKVITPEDKNSKCTARGSVNELKWQVYDRLCAYSSSNNRRRKL